MVEDGSEIWKQWIGCWAFINGFDISPDERYIGVGSKAGYLTLVNTSDGSVRFTKDIHGGSSTCRFSPVGSRLAVGAPGGLGLMMLDLDGNLLWQRYRADTRDIRFSDDGNLIFVNSGGVFDAYGTTLYDILSGFYRDSQTGWANSDATRFIFAVRDTPSSQNNIIEVYSVETSTGTTTTTTIPGECDLLGDNPPCGEVTLSEVIDFINLWAQGQASLGDVVALINAWASG
jgi:WD40 repeat protein